MADDTRKIERQVKNLYDKGYTAYERGNLDYAIRLLRDALRLNPDFYEARKLLRIAQIKRFLTAKKSPLAVQLADLLASPKLLKAKALLARKKYAEAMALADDLLGQNPFNTQFCDLFLAAAEGAGDSDAALITLEALSEAQSGNLQLLLRLGKAYMAAGIFGQAADCFAKANALKPGNLAIQRLQKDADAKNTMSAGGWEANAGKVGGYVQLIRNKELAAKLDQKNQAVATLSDLDAAIADGQAKIAREPKNVNFYRALARAYSQAKRFTEAAETLRKAQEVNPGDPELERSLVAAETAGFDQQIQAAKEAGDTQKADDLELQKEQFVYDNLVSRVERYPNDLNLKFELGTILFRHEEWDEAISQFQLAQKSPKLRLEALYHLAVCFMHKGQRDMAVMQLETANEQLPIMDDLKKRVVYTLGQIAEANGDPEKAFAYYKQVYAEDIGFLDIGQRMEKLYQNRK